MNSFAMKNGAVFYICTVLQCLQ